MQDRLNLALIDDYQGFAYVVGLIVEKYADVDGYNEVDDFVDKNYDCILCDLRLRQTWGIETIERLRAKTQTPIVVLTGLGGAYLSASDMLALTAAGANEVFNKEIVNDPTFISQIVTVLEKIKSNGTN